MATRIEKTKKQKTKQNNKKKTTSTIRPISELSFPSYQGEGDGGTQQSYILGDSALFVQHITLLYTSFD